MTLNPHRLRRFAKWVGVGVCVLLLVAWPVSLNRRLIGCAGRTQVSLEAGVIAFVRWEKRFSKKEQFFRSIMMPVPSLSPRWWPRIWKSGGNLNAEIPLYMIFFATAIPTYILFRRDRRHPQGHCQKCGYNLTGNESGRCSECGEEI